MAVQVSILFQAFRVFFFVSCNSIEKLYVSGVLGRHSTLDARN